jgi:hypothetical protein
MHRTDIEENETSRFHHADGELPASFSGPPQGEPVMLLGDVVALVISDLSVRRKAAPVDTRKESEGRVLRFAAPKSV